VVVAAGLLVVVGLALFLGGVVTGSEGLYWACVAVCGVAAAVLVAGWVRAPRGPGPAPGPAADAPPVGEDTADSMAADTTPQPAVTPAGATALRAEPRPAGAPRPQDPPAAAAEAPPTRQHAAHAAAEDPDGEDPDGDAVDVPVEDAVPGDHPGDDPGAEVPRRRGAHEARGGTVDPRSGELGEEDVEVTDLLLVVDLADEVLVVDEHPRYHVAGCPVLDGRATVPLPMVEARTDGFTPCAACRPVRHLADLERSRRRAARG